VRGRQDIVERARATLASGGRVTTAGLADLLGVSRAFVVVALTGDGGFRQADGAWEPERSRAPAVRPPAKAAPESQVARWLREAGRWCTYPEIAAGLGLTRDAVITIVYNLNANGRLGGIRRRWVGYGHKRHMELIWEAPTV
jgi:hypothetical protein